MFLLLFFGVVECSATQSVSKFASSAKSSSLAISTGSPRTPFPRAANRSESVPVSLPQSTQISPIYSPQATATTSSVTHLAVLILGIVIPIICFLAMAIVVPIAVNRRSRPLGLEDSWNDPRRYTIDSDLNNA